MIRLRAWVGKLPPKPADHPDILDHVDFTIDPHHSIHTMSTFVRAMGTVLDRVGLGVLHNVTDTLFITSDNPVVYFDPHGQDAPDHHGSR